MTSFKFGTASPLLALLATITLLFLAAGPVTATYYATNSTAAPLMDVTYDNLDSLNHYILSGGQLRDIVSTRGAAAAHSPVVATSHSAHGSNSTSAWVAIAEVDTGSMCSVDKGCPRTAMVWASGSFVFSELLTPGSFVVDANLSLKLSLCCGYKYNGAMLRHAALYDAFLEFLLQASPFQVLSPREKRHLFPRDRAVVWDTKLGKQYTSTYALTADDLATHNDGDGDVLLLFTGKIGAEAVSRVSFAGLRTTATGPHSSGSCNDGGVAAAEEEGSADVQLRIVNTVLKCKCPHTLLVMPLLRLRPDELPPVEILGLGPHCGIRPMKRAERPHRFVGHVTDSAAPGGVRFATSFAVSPAVLPATEVTWTVVDASTNREVLRHHRLLPAVVDHSGALFLSDAASPFFFVEPNTRYEVSVELSRGPWVAAVGARGDFTLRLPLNRTWPVPATVPAPHFGVHRELQLDSNTTLAQAAVVGALQGSAVSWRGAQQRQRHYHGYWENAPLRDQPLPQTTVRVPHNPFAEGKGPSTARYPLFVGRNLLAYMVSDADDVCDPTALEYRELWALQGVVLTPTPVTVCGDAVNVQALALRHVLHTMRTQHPHLTVNVPDTAWLVERAEEGVEGSFFCNRRKWRPAVGSAAAPSGVEYEGSCASTPTFEGGVSGTTAQLQVLKRGVYDVQWVARVAVDSAVAETLLVPENVDSELATVLGPTAPGAVLVEIRSRVHIVVRRVASYPPRTTVTLPMHERRWRVGPPDPLPESPSITAERARDALHDAPTGYWVFRNPLRRLSVDERMQVELDTSRVPNVQRVLPNGTLLFVVQDAGEDMSASYQINYTSRCPDAVVEMLVSVVAVPSPPVIPGYLPVYTEEECVELEPPRPPRKDEVVEWRVPACAEAMRPPHFVEAILPLHAVRGDGDSAPDAAPHERAVMLACGVEVYHRCDVVWTATNLVGTVTRTFSLRRCQRPPSLLFHADGLQQDHSYPSRYYRLPVIEEEVEENGVAAATTAGSLRLHETGDGRRRERLRSVIPVAGYAWELGYSFNSTGRQLYFEAELIPLLNLTANQLVHTRTHWAPPPPRGDRAAAATRLALRRRLQLELVSADSAAATWDGDRASAFWDAYEGSTSEELSGGDVAVNSRGRLDSESRLRDHVEDDLAARHFSLDHGLPHRRLGLRQMRNSSLYPINYVVRASHIAPNPSAAEDLPVFASLGMCVERRARAAVLAISPRGAVEADDRFGTTLAPPPAPAVAVLPFCTDRFIFSRHPDLSSVYDFDFTWECAEPEVMRVDKISAVLSILTHASGDRGATPHPSNETNCQLTVRNHLTGTARADWFLVKRVHPSGLANTEFVILSVNSAAAPTDPRTTRADHARPVAVRRVVGKSAVLHVDAPSDPLKATWQVLSVVPSAPTHAGPQAMIDTVQFLPLYQHPAAIQRGRGGATVLAKGLDTPGLYTIAHSLPDPDFPGVCPNVSLVQTIQVVHAQVRERELVVCGDTATLRAVPLLSDLMHDFVGQWEVVSLQTSPEEVWTNGANFTGMRFVSGSRPDTLVHGLPFGIVTIRWAIYRVFLQQEGEKGGGETARQRVLVDYDTVRVLVLTESLVSQRLVTLADSVEIVTTSSTVNWAVARQDAGAAASSVRLLLEPVANETNMRRGDASLLPHQGRADRLGAGLLTVRRLPVGTVRLTYNLKPSLSMFGPMIGHTCSLHSALEVERVSAFLTAATTLDHECDAYSGRGKVTLCLHAQESSPQRRARRHSATPGPRSTAWESSVRLAPSEKLEAIIKDGAQELVQPLQQPHASAGGGGCAVPWWVWRNTEWLAVSPVTRAGVPDHRCVSITVRAPRHLSPREAAQSLFTTSTALGFTTPSEHARRFQQQQLERLPAASDAWGHCTAGSDFITSAVIDGAAARPGERSGDRRGRRRFGLARYLPVLHADTLARVEGGMRPMVGLQGLPDEVTSELSVTRGNESAVTLRLDLWQPRQLGGYPAHPGSGDSSLLWGTGDVAEAGGQTRERQRDSLLVRCVEGAVTGVELMQYWTETNRPDGAVEQTAEEWEEYVRAVGSQRVPCEVLFPSLEDLLSQAGNAAAAAPRAVSAHGPRRLVSLEKIEQQLESIQMAFRMTKDGIDVTGLRGDLQDALSRRRITSSQLRAIEAARRARKKKEDAEAERRHRELAKAPTTMTRTERLLATLKAYKAASGGEVAAIRIVLPTYEAFTVPYDLFLRTALHKDVICGTSVSPPVAVPVPNPYSLVPLGRVEIVDVPPVVVPAPLVIKQCEVEGGVPVLVVNVTGDRFSTETFTADRVLLEEIPNSNISVVASTSPGVGLRPCLLNLYNGMRAVVATATRKHLYLQLNACPSFQMLAPEEYNEHQDSEELLQRLQHPRYLRITVKDALAGDSFTSRGGARNLRRPHNTTDISFVITVAPTLARLHLHPTSRGTVGAQRRRGASAGTFIATPARPLVLCEADMREYGFELGVELIGDQWTSRVGQHGDSLFRNGHHSHQQPRYRTDGPTIAPPGGSSDTDPPSRYRSPQNVALLNSFSVVEHHSLDSSHHLYLKGGGVYRSHFVNYLFSTVLRDHHALDTHDFVRWYNHSFVGIDVPPQPQQLSDAPAARSSLFRSPSSSVWYGTEEEEAGVGGLAGAHGAGGLQQRGRFEPWGTLPAVRRFSKIEEILFAVPGLATECHGCLLADTTFFVAGDLTGLWTFSTPAQPPPPLPPMENALIANPLVVPWDSAEAIPRVWRLHWMCPGAADRALRHFHAYWGPPVIPRAGEAFVEVDVVAYALRDATGAELPVTQRPITLMSSAPIPLASLLRGGALPRSRDGAAPLQVTFQQGSAEAAYTTIAADLLRHRQRRSFTSFEYHHSHRFAGGLLSLNASVFVKLCVPMTIGTRGTEGGRGGADPGATGVAVQKQCTVVSITNTLVTVEPLPSQPRLGLLRGLLSSRSREGVRDGRGRPLTLLAILLQISTAALFFVVLPILGIVEAGDEDTDMMETSSFIEQLADERYRARVGLSAMFCVAMTFLYVYAPPVLWTAGWVGVWTVALYSYRSLEVMAVFVMSAVCWRYTMGY